MAIEIKTTPIKIGYEDITTKTDEYTPFPTKNDVTYNKNQLLPIGLLSCSVFDGSSEESVLIALPISANVFYGDVLYISYSLTEHGWEVDEEDRDNIGGDFDSYRAYFDQARDFYQQHEAVTSQLIEGNKSQSLFELGGQPALGCNWDEMFTDEDNEELRQYFDVVFDLDDDEDEEEFDEEAYEKKYNEFISREIVYHDEDLELDFLYLGCFKYDTYVDGGGEAILFYQPTLKKVMVFSEFS